MDENVFSDKTKRLNHEKEIFQEFTYFITENNKWIGEIGYLLHYTNSIEGLQKIDMINKIIDE